MYVRLEIVMMIWTLCLTPGTLGVSETIRSKRIIGGIKISDRENAPYKSLQYFVWIGTTWSCWEELPWWKKVFLFWTCDSHERSTRETCGGALISPSIVQTACHCVAQFKAKPSEDWGTSSTPSGFEQQFNIYMGATDVFDFKYPILSRKFVVHELCGKLTKRPYYSRFDIGWIALDEPVPDSKGLTKGYWGNLDYAGPYTLHDLDKHYFRVVGEMLVCLVIGYGLIKEGQSRPSKSLRHAWIQTLSLTECYEVLWVSYKLTNIHYNSSTSYVCSVTLPTLQGGGHTLGDSGGPISCDNVYFSIVSAATFFKDGLHFGYKKMMRETPIFFAPEANSRENRLTFEDMMRSSQSYRLDGDLRVLHLPEGLIRYPAERRIGKHITTNLSSHIFHDLSTGVIASPTSVGSHITAFFIPSDLILFLLFAILIKGNLLKTIPIV